MLSMAEALSYSNSFFHVERRASSLYNSLNNGYVILFAATLC